MSRGTDTDVFLELLRTLHGAEGYVHPRVGKPEVAYTPPPSSRYNSTVMKMEMMLHFATVIGPFTPERQRTSPAYTKFIKQLLRDGLVERPSREERDENPGWAYRATERGRAYVAALCDVQLPVEIERETTIKWGIPA